MLEFSVIPGNLRVGGLPAGSSVDFGDGTSYTFLNETEYVNHKYKNDPGSTYNTGTPPEVQYEGTIDIVQKIEKKTSINPDGSSTRGFVIYGNALKSIDSWGAAAISNIAFFDISENAKLNLKHSVNLESVPVEEPLGIETMCAMFMNCPNFNSDISGWRTDYVTDMDAMFMGCTSFDQDLSAWNVISCESLLVSFSAAEEFNSNLGDWYVKNVNRMKGTFFDAEAYNSDMSGWCVTDITDSPFNFAADSGIRDINKLPDWGTCSDPPPGPSLSLISKPYPLLFSDKLTSTFGYVSSHFEKTIDYLTHSTEVESVKVTPSYVPGSMSLIDVLDYETYSNAEIESVKVTPSYVSGSMELTATLAYQTYNDGDVESVKVTPSYVSGSMSLPTVVNYINYQNAEVESVKVTPSYVSGSMQLTTV